MNSSNLSLRVAAWCAVSASLCATCMSRYFGETWGTMAAFLCCALLFYVAVQLKPRKKEAMPCVGMGAVFALMYTLGYSYDRNNAYDMLMRSGKTLLTGALCMTALSLVAGCVCLILMRLIDRLRIVALRTQEADSRERKKLFLLSAGMIFLGSVPYLLLYAPGLNIYDTHDQLLQFFGYPSYIGDGAVLSDHHPVFLTVVYGGIIKLGLLLGNANIGQMIYSVASMALLAGCWAEVLCTLYDAGLTKKACTVIAGFVALYPVYALYAFNMCKDVSVAPFVLLYVVQMIRLYRSKGEAMKSRTFCIGLFANLLMLMLTRKPSMYTIVFGAVFLLIAYRGVRLRLGAVLLGAVLLFQIGYNGLLLPALDVVAGESREMLSIPFQQTARYLNTYPEDVTQEEMEAISRVLDVESCLERYNPRLSDPVKDSSNPEMMKEIGGYIRAWVSMGLRHPGVYVDAWLNMIYGYFYPSDSNTIVCLTLNSPDQGEIVLQQNPALKDARIMLHDVIYGVLRKMPGIGMLFYVNTITWAFLFLLMEMIRRNGLRAAAPWMFFFGTLGVCMLSPKSGEIRYLMPIFYALPAMLGMLLCDGTHAEKQA